MIGLLFYQKDSDNFFLHNIQLIIFLLTQVNFFSTLNFSLTLKISFENYQNFDESFSFC